MTRRSASALVGQGRALRALPATAAAAVSGSLSGGQLVAVLARLNPRTAALWADHEAELVAAVAPLGLAQVSRAMAAWAERADPDGPPPSEPDEVLHCSKTLQNTYELSGRLGATGGAVVATALALAAAPAAGGEPERPASALRAQALVDICRSFLDHRHGPLGPRTQPHLSVVVQREDLVAGRGGALADGGTPGRRHHRHGGLRQLPAPGGHGRPLGGAPCRHGHPDHRHRPMERAGGARRAVPLPRL